MILHRGNYKFTTYEILHRGYAHGNIFGAEDPTLFSLPLNDSSLSNLDQNITINGTTVSPTFIYEGKNASAASLVATVGTDLPAVGSGANITLDLGTPLLDETDEAFMRNGSGKYYQYNGSATAYANPGADDLIYEGVIRTGDLTAIEIFVSTRASTGIYLYTLTTNNLRLYVSGSSGVALVDSGNALSPYTWYHFMFFVDKSGFGQLYLNGVATGSAGDVSGVGTINNSAPFTAANSAVTSIAWLAMWQRAGWLDTHLQPLVAAERFQKLTGTEPEVAKGTKYYYGSTGYNTRTSIGYLDKLESGATKYYLVGAGWPRLCYRQDIASTDVKGYLSESAATNLCLQSADLSTTWAKENAGDTISTNVGDAAPTGDVAFDAIVADATDTQHGVSQDIVLTAADHVFSTHVHAGDKGWAQLAVSTIANCNAYFDISNGVVGTKGAGVSSHGIKDLGNGIYRIWIVYTGTAAGHTHLLRPAHADTDNDFAGDGVTVSTYFWGTQVEAGVIHPSSYIATTTTQVTRSADYLYFRADDGNWNSSKFSVSYDILYERNQLGLTYPNVLSISDGTSAPLFTNYTTHTDVLYCSSVGHTSNPSSVVAGRLTNNKKASIVWTGQAGVKMQALIDGNKGTTDTTDIAFAATYDRINVGKYAGGREANMLVTNLVIRKGYDEEAP